MAKGRRLSLGNKKKVKRNSKETVEPAVTSLLPTPRSNPIPPPPGRPVTAGWGRGGRVAGRGRMPGRGRGRGRGGRGRGPPVASIELKLPPPQTPDSSQPPKERFNPKESISAAFVGTALEGMDSRIQFLQDEPDLPSDDEDEVSVESDKQVLMERLNELGISPDIVLDEEEPHKPDSEMSMGHATYILDLASQKKSREKELREEALEEALTVYKKSIEAGGPEDKEVFLVILDKVQRGLKQKYKEHYKKQDERLDAALQAELERRELEGDIWDSKHAATADLKISSHSKGNVDELFSNRGMASENVDIETQENIPRINKGAELELVDIEKDPTGSPRTKKKRRRGPQSNRKMVLREPNNSAIDHEEFAPNPQVADKTDPGFEAGQLPADGHKTQYERWLRRTHIGIVLVLVFDIAMLVLVIVRVTK